MMETFPRDTTVHDSAPIARVAYHPQQRRLRIWFTSTQSCWEFAEVYPATYGQFMAAYSLGRAFNELIRDRYDGVRVDEVTTVTRPASKPERMF